MFHFKEKGNKVGANKLTLEIKFKKFQNVSHILST